MYQNLFRGVVCNYWLMWWFGRNEKDIKRDNPQIWCRDPAPDELYNVLYTSNCIFASKDKDGNTNDNKFSTNTLFVSQITKLVFVSEWGGFVTVTKNLLIFFNMNQIQNERIFVVENVSLYFIFYNVQQ